MNDNIKNQLLERGFTEHCGAQRKTVNGIRISVLPQGDDSYLIIINRTDNYLMLPSIRTVGSFLFEELDGTIEFFS